MTGTPEARRADAGPLERFLRPFAEVRGDLLSAALVFIGALWSFRLRDSVLVNLELVVVWLFIVIGIGRRHRALTGDGNAPTPIG